MNYLSNRPRRQLTLFDSISIIVGIVIGAGIYETTPMVAQSVPGPFWLIGAWILGGIISLIGAACFAELTTTYPHEGGDYVFLTRAYGRRMGFMFVWAGFWIVRPANIGAIAYIFARYAGQLWPLQHHGLNDFMVYAVAGVFVLTLVNVLGVQSGKWTQNLFSVVKVLGLLVIIIIGFFWVTPVSDPTSSQITQTDTDFSLAMILILFTYGGWSSISYVAAEVQNPQKNILHSLLIGTSLITLIYILINIAFLRALGFDEVAGSSAIASDVIRLSFGERGADIISLLICITCLGNINGMIFTNARIYYAMGQEHRMYSWLGFWSTKLDSPVRALVMQAVITLGLIIGLGGHEDAFQRLVIFSAPLHWFFYLLVGISLFILRIKESHIARAYRVPLYPITPLLFCLSTFFMLYASVSYAYINRHPEIYAILVILVIGMLFSLYDPPGQNVKNQ
jgi:amino acid transporter